METNQNLIQSELRVDDTTELHLNEAAKWAKFLGIVGYIMSALIAVVAFVVPSMFSRMPMGGDVFGGMGIMITIIYLLLAVLGFALSYFMHKFGTGTRAGIMSQDQVSLNEGLLNLKRFFRLYGIIVCIYLGFVALGLIVSMFGLMMGR